MQRKRCREAHSAMSLFPPEEKVSVLTAYCLHSINSFEEEDKKKKCMKLKSSLISACNFNLGQSVFLSGLGFLLLFILSYQVL